MTDNISVLRSLIPKRDKSSNKGTFGTLTVIGGSECYRGAPALACEAALRCGVGICRLASAEKVVSAVAARLPEVIFSVIAENSKGAALSEDLIGKIKTFAKSGAILVGIGMTDCFDTEASVSALISSYENTLIIDADGLNSIKTCPEKLLLAKKTPIITPHVGEMSRLYGRGIEEIKKDREKVALDFSLKYNCVTVLKDSVTVIASPDGRSFICNRENSALSKGGSGDVLSGIIASLACQGLSSYDAAVCGVLLHSEAGYEAAKDMSDETVLPSDVIKHLTTVYRRIKEVQ